MSSLMEHIERAAREHAEVVDYTTLADTIRGYHRSGLAPAWGEALKLADAVESLQAQLDSMTVEWATASDHTPPIRTVNWKQDEEDRVRRFAKRTGDHLLQRLVSPWTVVEGAPDGQQ